MSSDILSPLIVRSGQKEGAIAQLSFLIEQDGKLHEYVVTNIYTPSLLSDFLRDWKQKSGKVVDLRTEGQNLTLTDIYKYALSSTEAAHSHAA